MNVMEGEGVGVVCGALPVPRGALSRPFLLRDLLQHCGDGAPPAGPVAAELDASGSLRRGALLAARARLAPAVPARTALLELAGPEAPPALRLRTVADLPPGGELLLWPHDRLLALVDMPFLTLGNIRGRQEYACEECGAVFEQPNPLKVHKFLSCGRPSPAAFWGRLHSRLRGAAPPAPPPAAARLEALAAEWGRSRAGHLCLYCGKLYSRRYGLKIHIRTHTGYKPLQCGYCRRAFGDPSNLNKHLRLHGARPDGARAAAGTGPHGCAHCGKTLVRRRDLERHVRARHPLALAMTP